MYLKFLQISSTILLSIFILAFIYKVRHVFTLKNLRKVWRMAEAAGTDRFNFVQKVRAYKAKGLKEFLFRRGKVSVWAEDKSKAARKLATAHIVEAQADRKKKTDARKARRNAADRQAKIRKRIISKD